MTWTPHPYRTRLLPRRAFVADLGRGAFAVAVVAIAGCAPGATASRSPSAAASTQPSGSPGPSPSGAPASDRPSAAPPSSGSPPASAAAVEWERVNLGFVSAYIAVRGGEAAIVDAGVEGSAPAIETTLAGVGLEWTAVGHLILTHHHGDHVGSATDVLERAPDATGYAGREDIASIDVPRQLTAVADGDDVFGLRIVTTPGHTAGSISVHDPAGGVLVAGDAIRTSGGAPALPGTEFTADMEVAKQSIVKLGGLTFERLLVGHGEPIEGGASRLVAQLGSTG